MSVKCQKGKWYYQFMVKGNRKHGLCFGCNTETEAKEFEARIYTELCDRLRGVQADLGVYILKDIYDMFLAYSKTNKKDYHQDEIRVDIIKQYLKEDMKVSEVTPSVIENFKLKVKTDRGISNATVNRYLIVLSKAFNLFIINKKLNIQNPLHYVQKFKENNHIIRYLREDEEKKLFKELDSHLKPIVVCALTTGLRLSNILNLRWETIDIKKNFLEVLMQENKGHKKIQLPLSPKFKKELEKIGIKKSGYVFINPKTGKPYTTIKTGFNRACQRAGIENFRFHDLRHTVATRLVANGVDLNTVKEYMAHSDIKTTQRYMHPTPENMKNAVDILNSFL